jgi:hypothetical protein
MTKEMGCWQLTLVTTRSLNLLYFDGSSAAKMKGGPMDSQDLLAWGEIKEEWFFRERERIDKLCEWGKKYGLDGFVRCLMFFTLFDTFVLIRHSSAFVGWKWICESSEPLVCG